MLRDWKAIAGMTQTYVAVTNQYIDAGVNCNLMLNTAVSSLGLAFGPYDVYSNMLMVRMLQVMRMVRLEIFGAVLLSIQA